MHYILLVFCFVILTGIAILYADLLELNILEGMIPAVLTVILILGCSIAVFHSFIVGMVILTTLSVAGVVLAIVRYIMDEKFPLSVLNSSAYITLCFILLLSIFLFGGAVITDLDELRLWAFAPKYLLSYNRMYASDVDQWLQGTALFDCFFLKITGFREGTLYVVHALLCWIGLLLPFGQDKAFKGFDLAELFARFKDSEAGEDENGFVNDIKSVNEDDDFHDEEAIGWKRTLMYTAIVYMAIYSICIYGTKTCSPELPMACWAGGLGGWWITRKKKRWDFVVLFAGILATTCFSTSTGVILLLLVALLIIVQQLLIGQTWHGKKDIIKLIACIALVVPILAIIISGTISMLNQESYLLQKQWTIFTQAVAEESLTLGGSDLNYTFVFGMVLVLCLILIVGMVSGKRKSSAIYAGYILFSGILSLFAIFINMKGIEDLTTGHALTSTRGALFMTALYFLIVGLVWLFFNWDGGRQFYLAGLSVILLLLFVYGLNEDYLSRTTALKPEDRKEYAMVQKVKKEADALLADDELHGKIYMLNQDQELASAAALFHLGKRINNYTTSVWKFTTEGGMVYDKVRAYETIRMLPIILTEGKYSYVWVYQSDNYLKTGLPFVMGDQEEEEADEASADTDTGAKTKVGTKTKKVSTEEEAEEEEADDDVIKEDDMIVGQLYKVVYEGGKAAKLEHLKSIVSYDNRKEFYQWNNITR